LHRLALAAIWRAPKRPEFLAANRVAGIPELGGDPAVARILEHTHFFTAPNLPGNLSRELKLIAAIVDGPGTVRLHPNTIIGGRDEIVRRPLAWSEADIRHANNGQAIPAFGAHGAGGTIQADELGRFPIREITAELAVFDDVRRLRGNALVVIGKCAKSRARFQPPTGAAVDDSRPV